ncbi:hypothetical protein, partial [Serratia marcescens]|uniref:hypothetical protein n=1 Tax=Serratia marcescens TaxID=615 RepID=UPI0011E69BA8
MAAAIIAAGSVVPLQAQAAHHTKSVSHKTPVSGKKKRGAHPAHAFSYGALQRMHNRALLLAKVQENKRHAVPVVEG